MLSLECRNASGREFTDVTGRKIVADLVSHGDGWVEIKIGNGTFGVPIEKFSDPDQSFIKEWIAANPKAQGYRFRFVTDLEQSDRSIKDGVMVQDKLKTFQWGYNTVVYNQSKFDLAEVDIRYEIYVNDVVDTNGNRYAALAVGVEKIDRLQTISGKLTKKSIPAGGKIEFTHAFPIEAYVDRDFGRVDQAANDKVIGIRIRIYKGDLLLTEFGDGEDDKRFPQANWQDAQAEKETPEIK